MVEIGIHPPQPSPHPNFWIEGGENFGLGSICFTPSLSVYRLIQPFHISSSHPISRYKYDEWLDKVEIGIWALKCLSQPIFWSWSGTNLAWPKPIFRTQSECVRTYSGNSQHPNHSNLSPLVYSMVKHGLEWNSSSTTITTLLLLSHRGWKFWLGVPTPTSHTKIECVQTDSAISYQLIPSNLSL